MKQPTSTLMSLTSCVSPLLLSLLLAGCATPSPPSDQLIATTEASIARATAMGAAEYAPAEIQSARTRLEAAREATKVGDFDLARRLTVEAGKDAELSEARLQSVKAERAAAQLQQGRRTLEIEIQRKAQ